MKVRYLKKRIYSDSDEDLLEFVEEEFVQRGNIPVHLYRNNVDALKKQDLDTLDTALARMVMLEDKNNTFKTFPIIITIIISLLAAYRPILEFVFLVSIYKQEYIEITISAVYLATLMWLILSVSKDINKTKRKQLTAIYFKELIEEVKK